jgi:hypothetical protein
VAVSAKGEKFEFWLALTLTLSPGEREQQATLSNRSDITFAATAL